MRTRMIAGLVALLAILPPGGRAWADGATRWTVAPAVPVPAIATGSVLNDVTVLSASDAWAVGAWSDAKWHPFAVHWNGTAWVEAPVPASVGSAETYRLTAVDGVGADQVFAVGAGGVDVAVTLRYDGLIWHTVAGPPAPPGGSMTLSDVDMLTGDDGWAVGDMTVGAAPTQPLVVRWQRGQWTPVPVPVSATEASLVSVVANSPDDAWAVGSRRLDDDRHTALVMHWDGTAWAEVAPPDLGRDDSLVSVSGTAGDLWAVGSTCDPVDRSRCAPLVLRSTAGGWQAVPAQNNAAVLTEVLAMPRGEIWVIGQAPTTRGTQVDHAEQWNGQRFVTDETVATAVPTTVVPNPKPASALALAAAAFDKASRTICAVGWSQGLQVEPHAIFRS